MLILSQPCFLPKQLYRTSKQQYHRTTNAQMKSGQEKNAKCRTFYNIKKILTNTWTTLTLGKRVLQYFTKPLLLYAWTINKLMKLKLEGTERERERCQKRRMQQVPCMTKEIKTSEVWSTVIWKWCCHIQDECYALRSNIHWSAYLLNGCW